MSRLVWTDEKIIEHIEEEGYKFIRFIDEKDGVIYNKKGYGRRIEIWCGNPNHKSYEVKFGNFKGKQKRRCPYCKGEKLSEYFRKEFELVKQTFEEEEGYLITKIIGEKYINSKDTIFILKCPNGHLWKTTYNNFIHGNRCSDCYGNTKLTYKYIKEKIEKEGYTLLSLNYINATSLLILQCPKGHIFKFSFNKFQQERRCPKCQIWKGEEKISNILTKYNVNFKVQHKYSDLKGVNNGLLSYDFYLPIYNLLIEYQGNYHDGTSRNQTEEQLLKQQEHDKRKREYAEKNNIQLLEIWYWDFDNIEEILIKELNL